MISARTGTPFLAVPPNQRGIRRRCAISYGTSPCTSTQPLTAPTALIAAKSATKAAGPGDQKVATNSSNGALDFAT